MVFRHFSSIDVRDLSASDIEISCKTTKSRQKGDYFRTHAIL